MRHSGVLAKNSNTAGRYRNEFVLDAFDAVRDLGEVATARLAHRPEIARRSFAALTSGVRPRGMATAAAAVRRGDPAAETEQILAEIAPAAEQSLTRSLMQWRFAIHESRLPNPWNQQ